MTKKIKIFMRNGTIFEFNVVVEPNFDFSAQCIRWRADNYIGTNNIHIAYSDIIAIALADGEFKMVEPQGRMQ